MFHQEKTRVQTRLTRGVQNPLGHKKSGVSAALRAYCDMERAHTSFYIFVLSVLCYFFVFLDYFCDSPGIPVVSRPSPL